MTVIRVGGALTLKAVFTVKGVNKDPTTITLEVKDPSGNVVVYVYSAAQITRVSTGIYSKVIEFDESGWWIYEWQATGAVIDVSGKRIYVEPQLI